MKAEPVSVIARRVASLLKRPVLPVYRLDGEREGRPLSLLVADDGSTLAYMRELAFPDGARLTREGGVSTLRAHRLVEQDADVVVVGANLLLRRLYLRPGFRLVPKWVRLFLPVSEDPYARLFEYGRQTRKYFKWMRKKVQDEGFICRVTDDLAWLEGFYTDMYVPYARDRYGDLAVVHSLTRVKSVFKRGGAIVVHKDGRELAGAVFAVDDGVMSVPHFGAAMGDLDLVRDGGNFAMDYYAAQLAFEKGCGFIDFGHSRAFLSDGPLRYKLNWHMEARDDDDAIAAFAMATPGDTEAGLAFLEANRSYELTDGGVALRDE